MLDFNLRVFLAVAKTNSFTKGAEVANITQPAVTHQIKSLEHMLNTKLFNRVGNKIHLTESGRILLRYANGIELLYKNAIQEILISNDMVAGEVLLGSTGIPGTYILPTVLSGFIELFPDVNLSMLLANSQDITQYIGEGIVELGVVSEPLKPKDFKCNLIYRDHLIIIVSAGHKWCERKQVDPHELSSENFIAREPGSGTREVYTRSLENLCGKCQLRTVISMGSTEAIKTAVMVGMGFSIVSRTACKQELEQGLLKEVSVKGLKMKRDFFLLSREESTMSVAARKLKEYLISNRHTD
ncbi:MAG: LysR family transcriptional regulator [Syntrophobacter sp.]